MKKSKITCFYFAAVPRDHRPSVPMPAPEVASLESSRAPHDEHSQGVPGQTSGQTGQCPGQAACSRFKQCPMQLGARCKMCSSDIVSCGSESKTVQELLFSSPWGHSGFWKGHPGDPREAVNRYRAWIFLRWRVSICRLGGQGLQAGH